MHNVFQLHCEKDMPALVPGWKFFGSLQHDSDCLLTGITRKIWRVMYALTSHDNLVVDAETLYFGAIQTTSNIFVVRLISPSGSLLARLPLSG
jgi:hypothetical protein